MRSPLDGDGNDRCAQVAVNLLEKSEACDLCFKPQVGNPSPALALLTGASTVWGMQLKQE